jgi:hypothetical protein
MKLAGAYHEVILGSGGLVPGILNFGIRWGGGVRFTLRPVYSRRRCFSISLNRELVGHHTAARSSGVFYVLCGQSRVK